LKDNEPLKTLAVFEHICRYSYQMCLIYWTLCSCDYQKFPRRYHLWWTVANQPRQEP